MATDIPAHSLFAGPDRGLLDNVVLRHDNGVITSISDGAPPPDRPARPHPSRLRQRPRPCPPGRVLVRRARHAAGKLDPALRSRHAARSLPAAASALARSARAGCAAMMIHYTRPSGTMPLVEEARADRARRVRCRHPHRLCARGARPEPGGLWRRGTGALRPLRRRPQHDRRTVRPRADVAARTISSSTTPSTRRSPGR